MAKGKYQEWLTEDGLLLLRHWKRQGFTDEQIAEKIGIKRTTLYDWIKAYPDISDALKKGEEQLVAKAEDALYKLIEGYEYTETTVYINPDGSKRGVQVTKYAHPNPTAIIFYLKNRSSGRWRDKPGNNADDKTMAKLDDLMSRLDEESGV